MTFEKALIYMTLVAREEEQHQLEHFLRVGLAGREISEDAGIVGLLHDLVEDEWCTFDMLRQAGFSEAVVGAVNELTRKDEPYEEYIANLMNGSILARQVKLIDLNDNMNRKPKSEHHIQKYTIARRCIEASMPPQA